MGALYAKDIAFAVVGVVAFVVALATGFGLKSFAFLAAAAWWAYLSRHWAHRRRQAQLRIRRLEREAVRKSRTGRGSRQ